MAMCLHGSVAFAWKCSLFSLSLHFFLPSLSLPMGFKIWCLHDEQSLLISFLTLVVVFACFIYGLSMARFLFGLA